MLSARRSLSFFLAAVVCLACWQVWLTWRLMEQDRNLEVQRSQQRLEQVADLAVAELARSLGDWDLALRELNSLPPSPSLLAKLPPNATLILITDGAVSSYPRRPLLFVPDFQLPPASAPPTFDAVDELEFRAGQYDAAIAKLETLAEKPLTRPEALLRTARVLGKAGRTEDALEVYRSLGRESALSPSGQPYALLATEARCRLLFALRMLEQGSAEATALRAGLLEGRWPIRHEAFEYYWGELTDFGIANAQPPKSSLDFAALVSRLFDQWRNSIREEASISGRELRRDSSLVVWNATIQRLSAVVTSSTWLQATLKVPLNFGDVYWKQLWPGASVGGGFHVTRSLAEVQIPGRLEFSSRTPGSGATHRRRSLWLAGVVLMVILVLTSGYAVHHGISQELRTARLQSDFMAAVSHEFRSPLTTLRTITELLVQNRIREESRLRQSYTFLDRETNRLHRLVEDLLDFGRMESGRKQYRTESHDAFQLVRAAVADFSEDVATNGFRVETNFASSEARVQADEEAFRRAVRNLLENAMKYSPECRMAWVDGQVKDHRVSISVRDRGMGIDPREQQAIFQRFVRGNAAKRAGIKGTGIGLSMVSQICQALGGEIRLESKVGAGSTFTIVLPLTEE